MITLLFTFYVLKMIKNVNPLHSLTFKMLFYISEKHNLLIFNSKIGNMMWNLPKVPFYT